MKLVIAQFQHETNTFSPQRTTLERFGVDGRTSLEAISQVADTTLPIAAFLKVAREAGAEIVCPVVAFAWPGGVVERGAYETISSRIVDAVAGGCDGVLLDLHGAMVVEGIDDGEGELLRRIDEVAPAVPVGVVLDFHANVTAAMAAHADVIVGYRTYPHIDTYEAGDTAARLLLRTIRGELQPKVLWGHRPVLSHLLRQPPRDGPSGELIAMIEHAEANGLVLSASVFPGFPLADTAHTRLSGVVVVDGDTIAGSRFLDKLLDAAWRRRTGFVFEAEPLAVSVGRAKAMADGPVLLLDHCDNCGAGGTQDDMTVIEEVMRQELEGVVVGGLRDPDAVSVLAAAGVGATVTLPVGGKTDMPSIGLRGRPLTLRGRVRAIADGRFTVTGPMFTGMLVDLGRTVLFQSDGVTLVLCEKAHEPFDLGIFTHIGVDPARQRYLLLKSRVHYRAAFEPILHATVLCAGRGVCTSDYARLPFRRLDRPIFPLDGDFEPSPAI